MGLRRLPWLQLARSNEPRSVEHYFDCTACKRNTTVQIRQHMGCGYEAAIPHAFPWDHEGRDRTGDSIDGELMPEARICPGYVCGLPEVIEASLAHMYWSKGELTQFCRGYASDGLKAAISILESEQARATGWAAKNPPKAKP